MSRFQPHPFLAEPLGLFLTWTTYGSWLPGDERGWTDRHGVQQAANPGLWQVNNRRLAGPVVFLDSRQRLLVEETIEQHCRFRGWTLHAVRCLRQHAHVVVTAGQCRPDVILGRLKARAAVRLNSSSVRPPDTMHQGAPRHDTHQGAPRHDTHQGAPRHDTHQGAPRHDTHQGAPRHDTHARGRERTRVWSRGGSMRRLYDEQGLVQVITYVLECQESSDQRECTPRDARSLTHQPGEP
jgi:REP element-mobilizing transposase RayT